MKILKISPKIYYAYTKDPKELGMSFLRFEEFYESPKFKGKTFTIEHYKDWYKKKYKTDRFDYCSTWAGFNVSWDCFTPFFDGKFKHFSRYEQFLLDYFSSKKIPFSLIGSLKNDKETLQHELSHSFWAMSKAYQKECRKILRTIPPDYLRVLKNSIKNMGYHKSVLTDEAVAYIISDDGIIKEALQYDGWDKIMGRMQKNFDKFAKRLLYKKYQNIYK